MFLRTMSFYPQFPKGFYFGSATDAYRIEVGWDIDGKRGCLKSRQLLLDFPLKVHFEY